MTQKDLKHDRNNKAWKREKKWSPYIIYLNLNTYQVYCCRSRMIHINLIVTTNQNVQKIYEELREKPTKHYRKIGNHKERDQEKEQRRTIKQSKTMNKMAITTYVSVII